MKVNDQNNLFRIQYIIVFVFGLVLFCTFFYVKGYQISLIVKSTLSGIVAFALPVVIYGFIIHRHDNFKNSLQLVIYDCIYALIIKYIVMISIFIYVFKFSKVNSLIFIIVFVFSVLYCQFFKIRFFVRKDNH